MRGSGRGVCMDRPDEEYWAHSMVNYLCCCYLYLAIYPTKTMFPPGRGQSTNANRGGVLGSGARIIALQQQVQQLQQQLQQTQIDNNQLSAQLQQAQNDNNRFREENTQLQQENTQLKQSSADDEEHIQHLRRTNREIMANLKEANEALDDPDNDVELLTDKLWIEKYNHKKTFEKYQQLLFIMSLIIDVDTLPPYILKLGKLDTTTNERKASIFRHQAVLVNPIPRNRYIKPTVGINLLVSGLDKFTFSKDVKDGLRDKIGISKPEGMEIEEAVPPADGGAVVPPGGGEVPSGGGEAVQPPAGGGVRGGGMDEEGGAAAVNRGGNTEGGGDEDEAMEGAAAPPAAPRRSNRRAGSGGDGGELSGGGSAVAGGVAGGDEDSGGGGGDTLSARKEEEEIKENALIDSLPDGAKEKLRIIDNCIAALKNDLANDSLLIESQRESPLSVGALKDAFATLLYIRHCIIFTKTFQPEEIKDFNVDDYIRNKNTKRKGITENVRKALETIRDKTGLTNTELGVECKNKGELYCYVVL